ncbi:MAG: 50S ribosomal protein L11 methyltransferase [Gemmatimonadales bacterium]
MTPSEFSYRDKKLGDAEAITVTTTPDVFHPTSTTVLLLRAARGAMGQPCQSVLDLGCGSGIVAVVLARLLPPGTSVCASDLSPEAVRLTRANAERNGVRVDSRCGSAFDPWAGCRFDLIVDDVSGVAEPLDRLSGWYPPSVPSDAGPDGARWILEILDRAPDHLTPGGRFVFPVLTLSREDRILDRARSRFAVITQVEEQWYPFSEGLTARLPLVEELVQAGSIRIEKRGSRWCWATKIYLAERPSTA